MNEVDRYSWLPSLPWLTTPPSDAVRDVRHSCRSFTVEFA